MKARDSYLGLDLGSVSLAAFVTDGSHKKKLWHSYRKIRGRSRNTVAFICREILEEWMAPQGVTSFTGALATGSGKEIVQELLGIPAVNEIVAHGTAAARYAGKRASVIEIGGQDSKFILVDTKGACDYSMNELCAAGTGAFLDVQAERLGLSIEELSEMAAKAATVPPMAGRCSVFAKSDIIHLQQRGVPTDQIVAGLCFALARNYVATLIRGREVVKPVVFQGGVALNDGVIRAFKEILGLRRSDIRRPDMPHLAGAAGAAFLSGENAFSLDGSVLRNVASQYVEEVEEALFSSGAWQMDSALAAEARGLEYSEAVDEPRPGCGVFIGLDVGSISTNAVALSPEGGLLAKVYVFTEGKPLEAAKKALRHLSEHVSGTDVSGVGVTGSGRKLVGHAVGADLVIDEITAQARGARYGSGESDTVIEIGGQDAKFITLGEDGSVDDFEMNRACSAGTGSFIQEQALRLGVDLGEEYSRLALSSREPLPFASRCTVFMESDLVHHIQEGVSLPDLLMGVSRAVVENYFDRVVQGRRPGRRVILQGGVARNRSVVKAMETRLKHSRVVVHPHPGVSGAIGVALLAAGRARAEAAHPIAFETSFRGMDFSTTHESGSFECKSCENRCEVSVYRFKERRFHFGDLCGKYSDAISGLEPGEDLTPDLPDPPPVPADRKARRAVVGIPRVLLFREFYPFWKAFFSALSVEIAVSSPSSSDTLSRALSRLPAETCLPVKLLFGHVDSLQREGVGRVFIPSVSRMMDGVSCPYIQHGASMVHSSFGDIDVLSFPLIPGLPEKEKTRLVLKVADLFDVKSEKVAFAYDRAAWKLDRFREKASFRKRAAPRRGKPLAVLLGKPYNTEDRFVNMSLAAKLAKAGFDVISGSQLNTSDDLVLPDRYNSITWIFSRRMLRAGMRVCGSDDMYPVVVGNFGCGPDAFTFPLLEEMFEDRPSLFLEFDEHRADAGLATRVEAFAHRVRHWRKKKRRTVKPGESRKKDILPGNAPAPAEGRSEFIIPNFSDHSRAFAGAIGAMGVSARVLPMPDYRSNEAGVELSGGRQCHPFQLIAGDLINLARSGDLPKGAVYLLPTIETSCLITQYVPTIKLYMEKLGRSDIRVVSANSTELYHRFGPMFMFNLGKAILGIEYLSRLRLELRPYEKEKGSVDAAYRAALEKMYERQLEDKVDQGIMEASLALDGVPTEKRGTRPVIAVTGDTYTRVNPAANGGLFELLEDLGCEVWASPTLVDIIMAGQEIRTRQYWQDGRPLDMISSWGRVLVNNLGAGLVARSFKGRLSNPGEPSGEEVLKYTEGLLPGEPEMLVLLNTAKHVDFANKGVDGILNVYCLNCLVGTATTSIFKGLAGRTNGVPMMPLVFGTAGGTHIRNRVEAFVHRVERNRREKRAASSAGRGADTGSGDSHVARLRELLEQKLYDVKMPNISMPDVRMPSLRMPEMKIPRMKVPNMWLPEGLWNREKKKPGQEEDGSSGPPP